MDHECGDCIHAEYIKVDGVGDWACSYEFIPNEEDCNRIYDDDERMEI